MKNTFLKTSKKPKDMEKIAREFLKQILKRKNNKATVVALSGDLGAGKTTFIKSIAKFLKVKRKVNSPTFVIYKKYPIKLPNHKFLFHFDAYRLKNEKEILHLGWKDIISQKENLVFIEWPERVKKAIPKDHHKVSIAHTKEGHRKFKVKV